MTAPQLYPEWHAARIGRVTGSVCGAILGLSPFMTRDDVLRSMVRAAHEAESEFTGNVATQWGTAMEPQARAEYEMDTGNKVDDAPFVPFEDWLGASPDGYVGKRGLVEFKCPYGLRNDKWPLFKPLRDQPHYFAQCQIEMFVTRRDWLDFYQWTPHGSRMERIEPDEEWLDANLPRLKQFHAEYLDAVQNPAEHLAPKRHEIDTPLAHKMIAEWDELAETIERAAERKKDLLNEIVALAGEKDALIAGRKLTLTKRQGAVAYAKALKAAAPDFDVEPYRGADGSFWGLR